MSRIVNTVNEPRSEATQQMELLGHAQRTWPEPGMYPGSPGVSVVAAAPVNVMLVAAKRSYPVRVGAETSVGAEPDCDVDGRTETWNAAVGALPADKSPMFQVTRRVESS